MKNLSPSFGSHTVSLPPYFVVESKSIATVESNRKQTAPLTGRSSKVSLPKNMLTGVRGICSHCFAICFLLKSNNLFLTQEQRFGWRQCFHLLSCGHLKIAGYQRMGLSCLDMGLYRLHPKEKHLTKEKGGLNVAQVPFSQMDALE